MQISSGVALQLPGLLDSRMVKLRPGHNLSLGTVLGGLILPNVADGRRQRGDRGLRAYWCGAV